MIRINVRELFAVEDISILRTLTEWSVTRKEYGHKGVYKKGAAAGQYDVTDKERKKDLLRDELWKRKS